MLYSVVPRSATKPMLDSSNQNRVTESGQVVGVDNNSVTQHLYVPQPVLGCTSREKLPRWLTNQGTTAP
jgi:hypothetical protein